MCNNNNIAHLAIMNQNPKDLPSAQVMIDELREKVRSQAEHIIKWKKAYALQIQQHYRYQKEKTEQMNSLTSQLLLLESRLKRKQKQIAGIIGQREATIMRQQKIIDALSSRLVDHGLDTLDPNYTEFDSLNDSDSAVVLEDLDSDCNSSLSMRRRSGSGGCDVTIVRSISDAIETNINKYPGPRRSNCFLRRPDILETVYSVEEDPEPQQQQQQQQQPQQYQQQYQQQRQQQYQQPATIQHQPQYYPLNSSILPSFKPIKSAGVNERRDKFKNRSERIALDSSLEGQLQENNQCGRTNDQCTNLHEKCNRKCRDTTPENGIKQVTNFNRVMSNHRSVTKPKDVKYKRINKAKSKSLEELRGRLKNWVEKGNGVVGETDFSPPIAQSYA